MEKDFNTVIKHLKSMANSDNRAGMARFGISVENTLGISMPNLRKVAKDIGRDHDLALKLWASGIHEACILAALTDEPKKVTEAQMDAWVKDFDSWDVCDQTCMSLFRHTPFAFTKTVEWSSREREFEKRAGFAMMATLAVHAKKADRKLFEEFLLIIHRESTDGRNFVKKAVNWALRQIGKKNLYLHGEALKTAYLIEIINSKSARWIAKDAIRELTSDAVLNRLRQGKNE